MSSFLLSIQLTATSPAQTAVVSLEVSTLVVPLILCEEVVSASIGFQHILLSESWGTWHIQ
jgi:hypothetical protein